MAIFVFCKHIRAQDAGTREGRNGLRAIGHLVRFFLAFWPGRYMNGRKVFFA